ncbi:MAG: hypothetical protein KJ569_06355 [Candidatus Omnitrophica bacterium]|nr:hypothetical protein [Candidatus Omnitrophota bacterium]MBU1134515.1 hypothetical protein [Candidatus Omnitrophota bacterium]MBU1810830.1 hypothetical protein [Candidatus Omnitrophota bacterium]
MKKSKMPEGKEFYIKVVNSSMLQDLYEFIYGGKHYEVCTLISGIKKMHKIAKSKEDRELAIRLKRILGQALNKMKREKEQQFHEHTKLEFHEEVTKAKLGDSNSMIRLIGFDKLFLFEPIVKYRVMQALDEEDYDFFHLLGEAIKAKRWKKDIIPGAKDEKQENLRKLLRILSLATFPFTKENLELLCEIIEYYRDEKGEDLPIYEDSVMKYRIRRTLKSMKFWNE